MNGNESVREDGPSVPKATRTEIVNKLETELETVKKDAIVEKERITEKSKTDLERL